MPVLDKKVKLGILNEIAQKSDMEYAVEIDLTDKTREFNFLYLCDKGSCFLDLFDLTRSTEDPVVKANAIVALTALH